MKTTLDSVKQEMVKKVIDALYKMRYMPSSQKEAYKSKLLASVSSKTLATTQREQSGLTNAYDYNQTAYELYLDIMTTFGYVDNLYQTINTHQMLNESIVNTLTSTIGALNDKLDEYDAVIGTAGSPYCYIEGFRTQNNQEWNRKYYTERYGERMPLATFVRFNSEQENITLNYTRQQNVMVYKSGVQLGEISITKQYGSGFVKARNSEEKLENAIDTSMTSYWAETILADSELKIVGLGYNNSDGLTQTNRSYYNLPRGAMCEICLNFESLAKVNEIVLKPFGDFPIDVIAIRYQLTDDEDDDTYDIIAPENIEHDWLISKTLRKEYAFHFPQIQCKRLYILINQLHCIKNTYMISCNQMFKNELWFNATYNQTQEAIMENTTVFAPLYLDRSQEDPVWRYINNTLITGKNIDINDLLINHKNKYLPTTKYEYTYGFYNIAPNYVEFQRAGVYVSSAIECDGPVDTVTLETEEEHFKSTNGSILTDIEFYITTKSNPTYQDWKPLCPKNKDYVYHELLQLDYDYCYLRHKAICRNIYTKDEYGNEHVEMVRPIVYMNDIVLTESADYILRFDEDNNVKAIEISNIDHFSIYTVSYMPTDSSKELSLISGDNSTPDFTFQEINANGSACYKLDEHPYYSHSSSDLTSTYVKLIDVANGKAINQINDEDSPIQCVTNKQNPADSFKNFIANTNKIQYYTNGKYLYFNQPIPTTTKIEISYPCFESTIRLKAILRRNTKLQSWLTPVLHKYKLMFTTI